MRYEVRALRQHEIVSLTFDASSEDDARAQAIAQSTRPISIEAKVSGLKLPGNGASVGFSLLLFSQELLALLEAGLTIVESIDTLAEKETRPTARALYSRLRQSLTEGKSFSGALETAQESFPPLFIGIVRAAERTSNLPEALARYVDYEVRLGAIRSKVISASVYPVILGVVGTLVSVFLLAYVVPKFAAVYQGTGRPLPAMSAMLLAWGSFAGAHAQVLLGGLVLAIVGGAVGFQALLKTDGLAELLARIPGISERVRVYSLARLYLTIGMLIDGGLPALSAMRLVESMLPASMRGRLRQAALEVERGERLTDAFERNGLTTPVSVRFLRVGERSGSLGEMLSRSARYYDGEISRWIDWFTRAFEPILMASIGLVVGLIVVLLYMPIFDLAGSF